MKIYGWDKGRGGVGWYRIREPLRGLSLRGHEVDWGPQLDDDIAARYNVIVSHTLWDRDMAEAWRLLAEAGQHTLVFDVDDNVWECLPDSKMAEHYTPERLAVVDDCIRMSTVVTTPSVTLAEKIVGRGLHDNVYVLGNYVPKYLLDIPRPKLDRFTVGYQGAIEHQIDLDDVALELYRFVNKRPDVLLRFYGHGENMTAPQFRRDQWESIPWQESVPAYYKSLSMTVGIAPLIRHPFNDCKSDVRAKEYMALGIPAIYADVAPYRETVAHQETGYLVHEIDRQKWGVYLRRLYNRPDVVEAMSLAARRRAYFWTTEQNAWQWEIAYSREGTANDRASNRDRDQAASADASADATTRA